MKVSVSVEIVLLYVLDLGGACSKDQVRLPCKSGDGDDTVGRYCSNQGQALVRRYALRCCCWWVDGRQS
jgi:hypothetical protein